MYSLKQIPIFLSIIPILIFAKSLENVILDNRSPDSSETTEVNLFLSDVISEEKMIESADKEMRFTTIDTNTETDKPRWKWRCAMGEEDIKQKVTQILKKFVPTLLKLRPIQRGDGIKIVLSKGRLTINKDFKIMGQPVCQELDEKRIKYQIMTTFEDLIGIYDWKIYNLFGNDFFETAIIKIKKIQTQLNIIENINGRFELQDIKVGKIDGFKVDVNIPEQITGIRYLKRMIQFIISKISTIVANRSLDVIQSNLQNSLSDSIKDKIKLNFNIVKEKLIFD